MSIHNLTVSGGGTVEVAHHPWALLGRIKECLLIGQFRIPNDDGDKTRQL